jgi:hypothetical protein
MVEYYEKYFIFFGTNLSNDMTHEYEWYGYEGCIDLSRV